MGNAPSIAASQRSNSFSYAATQPRGTSGHHNRRSIRRMESSGPSLSNSPHARPNTDMWARLSHLEEGGTPRLNNVNRTSTTSTSSSGSGFRSNIPVNNFTHHTQATNNQLSDRLRSISTSSSPSSRANRQARAQQERNF